jgi:capsular exopolysaccharide synthesis family protein
MNPVNLIQYAVTLQKKMPRKELSRQKVVKKLLSSMTTRIVPGTQLVELTVKDTNPEMSAKIANALAENYVKKSLHDRLFISDQLLQWFPDEAKALKHAAPMEQLRRLDKEELSTALPSVANDPVIQKIKEEKVKVEADLREYSSRYTEKHPKMKELRSKTEYLDREMKTQMDRIVAGLKANLSGTFNVTNIQIAEFAVVPIQKSGPPRLGIVLITTFGTTALCILLCLILDYMNRKIMTEQDVKSLHLSFLGYLPVIQELKSSRKRGKLLTYLEGEKRVNEDVMNFRSSVIFSMPKEKDRIVMCTSAIPAEGKSTVASLLAVSLSHLGEKIVLLDADLRKPIIHECFSLENKEGLSNYLAGKVKWHDIVREVKGMEKLHVITAGEDSPNPSNLLNSETFDQLLVELSQHYERIIIDVPPIMLISDGLIVAKRAHGIIIVFGYGMTHISAALRIRERLELAECNVIGGIINMANIKKLGSDYYYYYRSYHKYYRSKRK